MNAPPFHVVTSVWGKTYTQLFTDVGLPAVLSPGNLPALPNPDNNLYQILTTKTDRATIEASPAFRRLADMMPVQFDIIEQPTQSTDRHVLQSYCNGLGVTTADACDAAIVFLNPDVVIADGGLRSLMQLVARGKRAIDVLGVRMIRERAAPALIRRYRSADGAQLTVSPRQLVGIAMESLHPLSMMHVYGTRDYDWMPSAIFWPVGREGMIARCFHLHPMCVYPRVKNAPFSTTIDDDYLRTACPDPDDEYVVLDSDEFCAVEMSGLERVSRSLPRPSSDYGYVEWAKAHAKPHHVELFCHRLILHAERRNETAWQEAAAQSDEVTARILQGLVDAYSAEDFDRLRHAV